MTEKDFKINFKVFGPGSVSFEIYDDTVSKTNPTKISLNIYFIGQASIMDIERDKNDE